MNFLKFLSFLTMCLLFLNSCDSKNKEDHSGHNHSAQEGESCEGAPPSTAIELSPEAQKIAGIEIDTVKHRILTNIRILPGQVGYNENKMAHVSPRYAGIVKKLNVTTGDMVTKNQVLALIESNTSMSVYEVKSPIDGKVVLKDIVQGISVSEETDLFLIADLSIVWINCSMYAKDINSIKIGTKATIEAVGAEISSIGYVKYISPIFDEATQSSTLRIELSNKSRKWRPGMFINAKLELNYPDSIPSVHKDAIQIVDAETILFTPGPNNTFVNRKVITGKRSKDFIEIELGLDLGSPYVCKGAYELKSAIITSGMDPHAGHGH